VVTGLAIGALAAGALALIFPLPTTPPAVDDATLAPPDAPPEPGGTARPEPPAAQPLIRDDAPAPLVDLPEPGAPTGSPSLVPPSR
jgi:hypothetical protein